MIFGDLVALAKAGYTPAQVKELLAMTKEDAAASEKPAETVAEESAQPEPEKAEPAAAPTESKEDSNKDLQAQIADLKKQLEKSQADLAIAQKANVNGGEPKKAPTTEEHLADLFRSYM